MLSQLLQIKKSRERALRSRVRRLKGKKAELEAAASREREEQRDVRARWQAASDAEQAVESHLLYRYQRELSAFYAHEQEIGERIRQLDGDMSACCQEIIEVEASLKENMKGQEKLAAVKENAA